MNSIIVDFNVQENKFKIFDKNKIPVGEISAIGIIKYVTSLVYNNLFSQYQTNDSDLISVFICKMQITDTDIKIKLLNHDESILMGNVEILMKIYKIVHKCEKEQLSIELKHIQNETIKNKIIRLVQQFEYLLLSHIMKLTAKITEAIKNDNSKNELKEMLLKYSIACVYNLSNFMKTKIEDNIKEMTILENDVLRMAKLRLELNKKMDALSLSVTSQTSQINKILTKMTELSSTHSNNSQSDDTQDTSFISDNKLSTTSLMLDDDDIDQHISIIRNADGNEEVNIMISSTQNSDDSYDESVGGNKQSSSNNTNSCSNSSDNYSNSNNSNSSSESESESSNQSENYTEIGLSSENDYKFDDDDFYFTGSDSKNENVNYLTPFN